MLTAQRTCAAADVTASDPPTRDVLDVLDAALDRLPEFRDGARQIDAAARRADQPHLQGHVRPSGRHGRGAAVIAARARCSRSTASPSATTRDAAARAGVGPAVLALRPGRRRLGRRLDRRPDLRPRPTSTTAPAGPGRGDVPPAARRPAVRQRLRHVRDPAAATSTIVLARGFRLPPRYLDFMPQVERDPRRAARSGDEAHRAVPQRPAGGQHHGRRRPDLVHRLRVRRQQRPLLRARQHLERGRPRPSSGSTELVGAYYGHRSAAPSWPGPGCSR